MSVTLGDIYNTPANHVYVEAYGFVRKYDSMKSFVLPSTHEGQNEASLPPGIYDVFISEGGSHPRCKRLQIKSGLASYWTVKLETDDIYSKD